MKRKKTDAPSVVYYEDEARDEFSSMQIRAREVGDSYVYIFSSVWKRWTHFFWYRLVATPLAWGYLHLRFGLRIENREILRLFRKKGFFLYGNHTQAVADALIPSMLCFPKDVYPIVHAANVSIPFLGRVTPSMGALPLPDTAAASRNFLRAVTTRYREGNVVALYPEAHIWPYCTRIRNFSDAPFCYPAREGAPVFCFTNTYRKRKFRKSPRIVCTVDGPFFPDPTLPPNQRRRELRDRVYRVMTERSLANEVVLIEYRKKEEPNP